MALISDAKNSPCDKYTGVLRTARQNNNYYSEELPYDLDVAAEVNKVWNEARIYYSHSIVFFVLSGILSLNLFLVNPGLTS